jgi:hypothetical protein
VTPGPVGAARGLTDVTSGNEAGEALVA